MRKIALDLETLRVVSFATQDSPDWRGTVVAHEITLAATQCTTKNHTCPITYGCPYTTP